MKIKYYVQYERSNEIRTETATSAEQLAAIVAECKALGLTIVKVYNADDKL